MKKLLIVTLLFGGIYAFTSCVLQERMSQRANRSLTAAVLAGIPVPNSGFENTTVIAEGTENWTGGLKADGWTVVPPLSTAHTWSAEIVTNEESVRGVRGNALKLTNSLYNRNDTYSTYAVQVYTTVDGIRAGTYMVEARIKGNWDENQAGAAQFKVECLDRNGVVIFSDYPGQPGVTSDQFKSGELKTTDKNIWDNYQAVRSPRTDHVQYQYFDAPVGTTSFRLYCWFLAVGSVWFDNITIAEADNGEKSFFYSNKVFLYTDDTKGGAADVTLNPLYATISGGIGNFKVDFVLYDGEYYDEAGNRIDTVTGAYNVARIDTEKATVIKEIKGMSFTGGRAPSARFEFNKEMLPLEKHKYTLIATVWQGNMQIDLFRQNLYVYPRPSIMKTDEDGNFSHFEMDGEVFNPIILYHSANFPNHAKEAGANVVQQYDIRFWDPDMPDFFNFAKMGLKDNGLKAMVFSYDINEQTRRILNTWKDDPYVFAFVIADEPIHNRTSGRDTLEPIKLLLEERYRFVRDIDDIHPVYIVDTQQFAENIKYCDVLDIDIYPTEPPTIDITYLVTQAVNAADQLKPIFYLTGTYYWSFETWWRGKNGPPTANVIRNTIYRALEAGAKGVGYWSFQDAWQIGPDHTNYNPSTVAKNLSDTELWGPVSIISGEVKLLYDLFVNGKATVLYESGVGNETTSLFIRQWVSQTDGKMYLLAHNRSMRNRPVNINLKNAGGNPIGAYTAKPIGLTALSKPDAITGTNNINLTLGPEEIALFEIE
jgi:hypothetical protein